MNALTRLDDQIASHFNLSELEDLCFKLDINFENLEGSTLDHKSLDLVRYCQRHQRLDELLALLAELRPEVEWPKAADIAMSPKPVPADEVGAKPDFRRMWFLIPLLAGCLIVLLAASAVFVWRQWFAETPGPETTPAGISADTAMEETSTPPPATNTPVTQESNPPTRVVEEGSAAVLDPDTFPTETPFFNLLSEDRLVSSPGRSSYPAVLADAEGGLHLVWWDNTARSGAAGDIFYMHRPAGGEWGEIERLTDDSLEYVSEYETAIRLRADGVVCVFFADGAVGLLETCRESGAWSTPRIIGLYGGETDPQIDGDGQPFVVHRKYAADIQFEDLALSDGLNEGVFPKFAIDSEGVFHVVWITADFPYRLLHRQSSDKGLTWSEPEDLTDEATRPDNPFTLLAGTAGQVHLAWKGWDGGHFYRAWTADTGWSPAEELANKPENNCTSVALQSTANGELIFAWQGGQGIYVTTRPAGDSQPWSSPLQVSSRICRGEGPALAALPNGHLFLVYSDSQDEQNDLYGAELVVP